TNVYWDWSMTNVIPYEGDCYFVSNAVPAYVELELGVLENHTMERARAIGDAGSGPQRAYLSNHVANVHVFRQRIPIRNVDYAAYKLNFPSQIIVYRKLTREAYGVRGAAPAFAKPMCVATVFTVRKREQAPRTPYASRGWER